MKPEETIFADALALEPPERGAFLARACGADASLRRRVEDLLSGYDEAGPYLDHLPVPEINLARDDHDAENEYAAGARIGRYKLLERIGEGGHGSVFVAEQETPVRRRVALKVIKLGMDTREVIARFEAERQALALMDHPNIARVLDAGATERGRPYFVMELVRGVPITRHCDEHKLDAAERLKLFTAVCSAVQHAHQKGIIHRDLKPSNILVTLHDGVPVPKIIDFGIAKAMHGRLTDRTIYTRFEQFVGTPTYMSPEQLEMSGLDIDTRSDIYSLGVVLYELLTGRPPFESKELLQVGLDEMRRTIREKEPPRPSTRVSTLDAAVGDTVARQRGTDPSRLRSWLRGDIDWIVMRCLEKDRTRRYETPAALAADIERHLTSEPVEARPPSNAYRLGKFINRHRVGFFAATAVALALIAGLIASSVLLLREQRARARAVTAEQSAVAAGRTALELQHQAEVARADEVKRAARTSLQLANRDLADGRVADGLAYLVSAARKDPLNPILAPRLASVLASHNFILPEGSPFECHSRVVAVHYAVDGRTFMVGTEDGTMRVFDRAAGTLVREFRLGKPVWWITGWMFSSTNDRIFCARFQDDSLGVFDTTTGRQLGTSIQLDRLVTPGPDTVGLSRDGHWIFAYTPGVGKFWLWDAFTGENRLAETWAGRSYMDFDFSADSHQLSIAGANVVRLWSLPDFVESLAPILVKDVPDRKTSWMHARFLPDSRHMAMIDPSAGLQVYDIATGALVGPRIATGFGWIKAWEFSPDGRLLHVGDKASELRDLTTGQVTSLPFSVRNSLILDKYFSRDGALLLVTPTSEALASLWDTKTGRIAAEFTLRLPTNIRGALSPDGAQIVVGTTEGRLHRLRVGRGVAQPLVLPPLKEKLLGFLPEPPARLRWFTSERSGVLAVSSGREMPGTFAFPHEITEFPTERFGKSPLRSDHKFLVARNGSGWETWDLSMKDATKAVPLRGDPPAGGSVTFSPAADLVAIHNLTAIGLWDLRTGAMVGSLIDPGWPLWPQGVEFSPDGRRLAASFLLGAPVIWDVATGKPATGTFEANPERTFSSAQYSPDGTQIITSDFRGEARLWDSATGAPLSPLLHTTDMLYSATFAADGRYFATRSPVEVRVWEAKTATLVGEPIALPGSGTFLRFSSDGRRFSVDSTDGNARVFDVRTAQPFAEPMNHGTAGFVSSGNFSPDGRFLLTFSGSGFRIWSLPPALRDGTPPPEWLLQLATACAGKMVNDQGQLADLTDTATRLETVRAQLAALPDDAPLVDWGRWILNEREDRSIAPGFTMTPTEAEALKAKWIVEP